MSNPLACRPSRRVLRRRARSTSGAAAVEFALVSSLLFSMLFGVIQYGLYFNDSLNVRQGVRDTARQGAVENFPACSGASSNSAKLLCATKVQIGAVTGTPYVKVAAPSSGWAKGQPLTVCAVVRSEGALGLVPMPNGGWISSKTQMFIEQEKLKGAWTNAADTLPSGQTWNFCP